MAEQNIFNIQKIKVTCRNCDTVVVLAIGRSFSCCPYCSKMINSDPLNDYIKGIGVALQKLQGLDTATFELVCEGVV